MFLESLINAVRSGFSKSVEKLNALNDKISIVESVKIPYTGANAAINFNTQTFTSNGTFNKLSNNFEVKHLLDGTATSYYRRITDVASLSRSNDQVTIGDIVITLPIRTVSRWFAEIDISDVLTGNTNSAKLLIAGYSTGNNLRKVTILSGFGWITGVRFGRNSNNDTVLIIKRNTGTSTFSYGKVNISTFYHSVTHNSALDIKSNYKVEFINENTLSDFTLTANVQSNNFERDAFLLDYNNFTNKPDLSQYAPSGWVSSNFVTIGEANNIYDQLNIKANERLNNIVDNLSELEKSAIKNKLGLGYNYQFIENEQTIEHENKNIIVEIQNAGTYYLQEGSYTGQKALIYIKTSVVVNFYGRFRKGLDEFNSLSTQDRLIARWVDEVGRWII